jgi:hypothetical protein
MIFLGPAPTVIHDTKVYPLGSRGYDNAGNEYIYLAGVTGTVANDFVVFDEDYATTRIAPDEVGPCGVATSANAAATTYAWYGIKGVFAVRSDTVAADAQLFIDTAAGRVDDGTVAGDMVLGAFSMTSDTYSGSANLTRCYVNYPFVTNNTGLTS